MIPPKGIRQPSSLRKNDLIEHVKGYFPRNQQTRVAHLAKKVWLNKPSFRKHMLKPALQGLLETAKAHGLEPTMHGKKFFEKQLPHQRTVIDAVYNEGIKRQIEEQQQKNILSEKKELKKEGRRQRAITNMNKHMASEEREKATLSEKHQEESGRENKASSRSSFSSPSERGNTAGNTSSSHQDHGTSSEGGHHSGLSGGLDSGLRDLPID